MWSTAFSILFYLAAAAALWRRAASWRLIALALLPAGWITLCGVGGLLETMLKVPPVAVLGAAVTAIALLAIRTPGVEDSPQLSFDRLALLSLLAAAGLAAVVAWRAVQLEPWGSWDSMFTWVLRARFFLVGGEQWRNAFSEDLALLHPDYPPLLGWALAALWRLDGGETTTAIHWLILPCWPGLALLCVGGAAKLKESSRITLTLADAALLATPLVWKLAASRVSDFVLTYAILGSAVWFACGRRAQSRAAIACGGFLAAWAGLIKNEGLLWLCGYAASLLVASAVSREVFSRRMWRAAALGALIPVTAVVIFKATLAPPSDLVSPLRTYEISEIVQPGTMLSGVPLTVRMEQVRMPLLHQIIFRQAGTMLADWQEWGVTLWLALLLFFWKLWRPRACSLLLIAVALQLAGYYAVYIITPYHPYWHLSTSLSRIVTHVAPAALWLLAHDSGQRLSPDADDSSRRRRRSSYGFALAYLPLVAMFNLWSLQQEAWRLGNQPVLSSTLLNSIAFPRPDRASYVSDQLGIRDLYAMQFSAAPTVLVIDRREDTLLARFATREALLRYCESNNWRLQQSDEGLGRAINAGGKQLRQPVTVPRME